MLATMEAAWRSAYEGRTCAEVPERTVCVATGNPSGMSKLLYYGKSNRSLKRYVPDTTVRVYKLDGAGIARCESCNAERGQAHEAGCEPSSRDRFRA